MLRSKKNETVSMTDAKQSFAQVALLAEQNGHVVILKNKRPKYLLVDLDVEPQIEMTEDEKFMFVAERILREHRAAFEALARRLSADAHFIAAFLSRFLTGVRLIDAAAYRAKMIRPPL